MKCFMLSTLLLALTFGLTAGPALASTLVVNPAGTDPLFLSVPLGGTVYLHPQDAVNAASPGDTIVAYPGTYGSRVNPTPFPAAPADDITAPALIVYKDGLTIRSVESERSRHRCRDGHPEHTLRLVQSRGRHVVRPAAA